MSKQYSAKTIEQLRKRFANVTLNGKPSLTDLQQGGLATNYNVLLDSAMQLEGECYHSSWGDDYQKRLSEIKTRLPHVLDTKYLPNQPELVNVKGYENQYIRNQYISPDVKATNEVLDAGLFLEFLERQFPIQQERELVIALMAKNIREPQKKIRFALLIRGEQGTGKGVLMDKIWQSLVGKNYFKARCQQVSAKFNEYLATSTTVCIDEFYNNEKKNADNLKTVITDESISVEPKGKERRTVKNYCFFIATSNDEAPVYIESGQDRRWFVPQFSRHLISQKETQEFISSKLIPWLDGEGIQAIRNYLETIDLASFNFDIAMDTESKRAISITDPREESKEELKHFLEDNRYHGVRLKALKEMFKLLNQNDIKNVLQKCGYFKEENAKRYNQCQRYRWWINPEYADWEEYLAEPIIRLLPYYLSNTYDRGVPSVSSSRKPYMDWQYRDTTENNNNNNNVLEVCEDGL